MSRVWLHSARVDCAILVVPAVTFAAFLAVATLWGDPGFTWRDHGLWVSHFILGNTTHVILSFVLLWQRRDVLDAAPNQRALAVGGSAIVFLLAWLFYWSVSFRWSGLNPIGLALIYAWSTQHRLSQSRGVWSLYNLAAGTPPSKTERALQRLLVPVGVSLAMARALVRIDAEPTMVLPDGGLELPSALRFVFLAAWAVFAAAALVTVRGAWRTSGKPIYLAGIALAFAALLWHPIWGALVLGGIHGLEYLVLTHRLLGAEAPPVRRGLLIAGAMLPFAVIGSTSLRWLWGSFAGSVLATHATVVMNAVVLSHYFVDGVIYRLRIASVRSVVLRRLGFTPTEPA